MSRDIIENNVIFAPHFLNLHPPSFLPPLHGSRCARIYTSRASTRTCTRLTCIRECSSAQLNVLLSYITRFYGNLLVTLSKTFGLESYSVLDHAGPAVRLQLAKGAAIDTATMATRVMFQCLICLGDLSRYCITFGEQSKGEKEGWFADAAQYYRQASRLIYKDGSPHNQLAVLACMRTPINKLDVIFHYCCSMATSSPSGSTAANIRTFFQKHRLRQFPIPAEPASLRTDVAKLQQARMATAQHFCAGFVALYDLLWTDDAALESMSFETASSLLLDHFDRVLTATWLGSADGIDADIDTNGMFSTVQLQKIMAISICTVTTLQQQQQQQQQGQGQGQVHAGAGGMTLDRALFITLRMLSQLMVWLSQAANHEHGNINFDNYIAAVRVSLQWLHDKAMLHCIFEMRQTAGSTQMLWAAIAVFLNSGPEITQEQQEQREQLQQQKRSSAEPGLAEAAQPEDYDFRGFTSLDCGRVHIDFAMPLPPTSTAGTAETAGMPSLRTRQAFALARTLARRPNSGAPLGMDGRTAKPVAIDRSLLLPFFLGSIVGSSGIDDTIVDAGGRGASGAKTGSAPSARANRPPSDKERFMMAMAQQRMQEQVHSLTSSVAAAATTQPALPPFVCIDTKTSIHHLRLIQELISMQRFVVIVPLAVISGLDDLKKGNSRENKGAREATRWLERAFKQGEPNLRAQLRDESADLPVEPAADTPSDSLRILSCCMHFGYHESGRGGMVTLLTNESRLGTLACDAGIRTDRIETFVKLARF